MTLSPGEWYKRVPKEPRVNLGFRRFVLEKAASDPGYRAALWDVCKEDILFYVNVFGWQYNPNKYGREVGPFITWDCQDDALKKILSAMEDGRDLAIDKSRDMGISWVCLWAFEWRWHFHEWQKILVVSKDADSVDEKDNPDALFWKLDHIHRHQPGWLLPPGYDLKKHRRNMCLVNPNGSVITGEASTGKAGIGGRATMIFVDEFSLIREDEQILRHTSDTAKCRVFNGTHRGSNTALYRICHDGSMRRLRLHWTQHPDKCKGLYRYDHEKGEIEVLDKTYVYPEDFKFVMDGSPTGGPYPGIRSPWYDEQGPRKGSQRAVAMDLDIDPLGSVSQFFDSLRIKHLIGSTACEPWWEGELTLDRDSGKPQDLVQNAGGRLKLWTILGAGNRPKPGKYAIGLDLAAGTGNTSSCVSIGNMRTGEKVGSYANPHYRPDDMARLAVALCWLFKDSDGNGAELIWESNGGPGGVFGIEVFNLGYRNVYRRTNEHVMARGRSTQGEPGWYSTEKTKTELLEQYRSALQNGTYTNREKAALEECLHFEYDPSGKVVHMEEESPNDPSGARANHGDQTMADALSWKLMKSAGLAGRAAKEEDQVEVGSVAWILLKDREKDMAEKTGEELVGWGN